MDQKIKKTLTDIIAEAKITGKAGITEDDLKSLRVIIDSSYTTDRLKEIATSQQIRAMVLSEKIADLDFDKDSVSKLEEALKFELANPLSIKALDTKELKDASHKTVKVKFRPDKIDGVALMQNNAVAIFRSTLQMPSVIFCRTNEEAEKLYEQLTIEK